MTTEPVPSPAPTPTPDVPPGPAFETTGAKGVSLRGGGEVDVRMVGVLLAQLEQMQDDTPDLFAAVVGLARGELVPSGAVERLRQMGFWLTADGRIQDDVRAVVLSAVLETPEGAVLHDPLAPTEANRAAWREQDALYARNLRRQLGPGSSDDDQGGGRGR